MPELTIPNRRRVMRVSQLRKLLEVYNIALTNECFKIAGQSKIASTDENLLNGPESREKWIDRVPVNF